MITIKRCNEVPMEDVYAAFALGFSDYVIPMTLSQQDFSARFFGPEGNHLEFSFLSYDNDAPIGLILGGVRIFDHIKTMRCGTLCIAPDYRGTKVAQQLMAMHSSVAKDEDCKQLFLEVIKTNARAIHFYSRLGYKPVYHLKYYSIQTEQIKEHMKEQMKSSYVITEVDLDAVVKYRRRLKDIHINWQNEVESFEQSNKHIFLLAKIEDIGIGYIVMSPSGKIEQLYVEPDHRNQGVGSLLTTSAARMQKTTKVTACLSCNASFEGFLRKLEFVQDPIEQFEMYLPVGIDLE